MKSQEFSKRNKKLSTIWNFNTYIEAVMNSGSTSSLKPLKTNNLKGIIIKTVHSVKGGEFDVVFLPYQRSGSFPLNYRSNQFINKPPDEWLRYSESSTISSKEHHYEEERRLFYVALTRAKRKLFLLAPKKATSKFIKEIPIELMENKPMDEIGKEAIPSSKLKMKYEEFLQRALVDESYDEIKKISDVLIKIKQYENGKKVTFKNEYWDQKLQRDFQSNIVEPSIPEKLYLSASSIETYKTCPLKFRFNKIDKIPQNGSKPELIFGTIIHNVLQRFHKPGGELKKTRILDLLDQEWRKDDFDYEVREMKFKEQGIKILSQYVDYVLSDHPKVLEREMSFSFDIKDVTIKGSIDRIDEDRNGVKIIDYKTSKIASSAKSSLQLAVYCLYLLQSSNEKIKGLPSKAVLHFLRDEENPIKEHSFNILELKSVEKVIEKTAKSIRAQEFSPKKGKHCDWCDYKNLLCPEWGD